MSVHLECDRCGFQEQTSSVMLLAGTCGPGIPTVRPELPAGWTRPRLPNADGSADERELCPGCRAELLLFMTGAPVIDVRPTAAQTSVCRDCGHLVHESTECPALTMPDGPGSARTCGCTKEVKTNG